MVQILENFSLKSLNTFGIDQKAKLFAEINSIEQLLYVLNHKEYGSEQLLILGGGSNMLLCDDFDGLVLKIATKGIEHNVQNDKVTVTVQAGEVWHDFVMHCVANQWAGLENLSLIPGSVGASPIQNIGAYGIEVKDTIKEVKALNIKTLNIKTFSNDTCKFGYRDSVFKNELKGQYIVLSVTFELSSKAQINKSYGAIEEILKSRDISNPSIKDISDAVIEIRSSKLPNPKEIGNAGSFFKNPEVKSSVYEKIKQDYPEVPFFKTNTDLVKIPAGWLIEKAGWKGKTINNYGVHKNQALVLVNYGDAKGLEIKKLADDIQADVLEKFGINLQNEVNYINNTKQ